MKKILLLFVFVVSANCFAQVTTSPSPFEATQSVTLNFDKTGTPLASYTGTIYAHIGVTVNGTNWSNVIGTWGNNTTQPALTLVSGNVYKLDITPDLYTYFGVATTSSITKICVVFRNAAGTAQSSDIFVNVGSFQANLTAPAANSTTFLVSGSSLTISATNTGGSANYTLLANGSFLNGYTGSTFSYTQTNITSNKFYTLTVTLGSVTFTYKFMALVNPTVVSAALPSGMEDGINYNSSDPTKATLVLTAPGKDFVYVAGSFNSWQPNNTYVMKQDPTTSKFWLELSGLTSGIVYTYQYWVGDQTPNTAQGSPKLVKTADPYSTLVLSPFDDPWIPATSYPNIPTYPAGQEREVTVLQTGQTTYPWSSATTNFVKPSKDHLVVYEALIRDFNSKRTYQDLIDKISYLKDLNINAIELMPLMEYEGNEGWGYNPCYHLALDKFYGPAAKLKELVDLCHQNGIAVILDVALNHAFGRNPMVRMWMKDSDGDGWGDPANDNPYFNEYAKHSYGVGSDFNHSSTYTKYYTKRVIKQWIQEFKIDGFRWDLTKGFTQSCSSGNDACTNGYLQDRVDVLKEYADYAWSLDPYHYVIFEHLGIDSEEQQWANYRINETPSKGVMMWGEMNYAYGQLAMGYSTGADISRMGSSSRGFTAKRLLGYPESHDKDRIGNMANSYGASSVSGNISNVLTRLCAIAATSILVPGPKMIYQFGELGSTQSIFTCTDGTVNTDTDSTTGDCKLSTKPQPQWSTWYTDQQRLNVYNTYAKLNQLKETNAVFDGSYAISPAGNLLLPRIYIWDNTLPSTQLKNVVVLANFNTSATNVTPDFPYTGTWVNLMDNSTINVTSTSAAINIEAGGFRVYGNQSAALENQTFNTMDFVSISPNPVVSEVMINTDVKNVEIFNMTGQLISKFEDVKAFDKINLENLERGIYLMKCNDSNNNEKKFKIIKE
ncbi:alpha-amylase family glycosyl hydrolase [Flavobacterium aciduliphilum]|uniref:Putative secreted protein (Por secretion system target) n=1 Tax=Flavobacterium aciduliphilum TaxID=1101402 RepID=A0A328YLB0_9FLAO|nr:alpha-amylase family glycosyl hydrolase [Flavobacterium aciduliphilum]RAR74094.1 putative secreted protein (Por secretion system target) [Flavobacterium aciduliphilum]